MPLADHAPTALPPQTGRPCSISALLRELDDDDRAELLTWLDTYPQVAIWESLRNAGHIVSLQQIGRHRRQTCRCYA